MHAVIGPTFVGDYYCDVVEDGEGYALRRLIDDEIIARFDDLEAAERSLRARMNAEPHPGKRSLKCGGDPITGPERYGPSSFSH